MPEEYEVRQVSKGNSLSDDASILLGWFQFKKKNKK